LPEAEPAAHAGVAYLASHPLPNRMARPGPPTGPLAIGGHLNIRPCGPRYDAAGAFACPRTEAGDKEDLVAVGPC
jgi:hypothetical protein